VYNITIEDIKTEICENKIWVSIYETCDVKKRFIANVVKGVLKTDSTRNIILLHSEQLDRTNNTSIQLFANYLKRQWESYCMDSGGINYDNVLLFLTDPKPYMVKAGSVLKSIYTKIAYTTCGALGIHRVVEEI